MLYNQPLDQPSNPNAPYVDGIPNAGIEGSIVPAASIEFDQREVVEVITRANARGYIDFSATPCAQASNSDLTQLRKAIEGFIRSWEYIIDSDITKIVHGPGADFTDLIAAFYWLSRYRITNNGSVTFRISGSTSGLAAQWIYTQTLFIYHPNIDRVFITGANLIGAAPTGADFQYTNNRPADALAQVSMLRGRFGTELHFVGGASIQVNGSLGGKTGAAAGTPGMQYLLITGDGTPPTQNDGLCSFNNCYTNVANCSFHGGGADGFVLNNAYAWTSGNFVSSSGQNASGFEFQGCLALAANQTISCSNGQQGFILQVGTSLRQGLPGGLYCKGNIGAGVYALEGSAARIGNSQFLNNGSSGIYAIGSQISATTSTFSGNVSSPVYAGNGAGVTITGSTGTAGCSPAMNGAQGNTFAWIVG